MKGFTNVDFYSLAVAAFTGLLLAAPGAAIAQCAGDCSIELLDAPKNVEKYVKKAAKALTKCAKRGEPACPSACPLPDATAAPYSLGASCAALVACELQSQTADAVAPAWDAGLGCALAAADACGNARGGAAAKVLVSKLKRRRTSKMDKFPRDLASCVARADKAGVCDGETLCAATGAWLDAVVPIRVTKGGYQTLGFSAAVAGEAMAVISLSAEAADWGNFELESVVLEYDVDGVSMGTIVVYDGANAADYRVLLGDLAAGAHTLGLRQSKKLSPASTSPALVHAPVSVSVLQSGDPGYDALRFAPVLLGIDTDLNPIGSHPGNAVSDVPVIEYVRAIPGVGQTTYRYVMIWSNEDGGTGIYPEVMMAQYGRTTDIEGIVEVDVSDLGVLEEVRFRPDESGSLTVFAGSFVGGTHPVVRTRTANGLIEDDGDSTLRFLLAPFEFDDAGVPREQGMDLDPLVYRVMAKEIVREAKHERPPNPNNKKISDQRNYLFVEYDIDVDSSARVLRAYAVVGGTYYGSDHYQLSSGPLARNVSDGVGRTAVELPPGTTPADITEFGMQGIGPVSGTLYGLKTFMLGTTDYLPMGQTSFSGSMYVAGPGTTWALTP